jgi:hypothetical protein
MQARSGLQSRHLNHNPDLAVEQAPGPSRHVAGLPHKIRITALGRRLHQSHPRRVRHCPRCLGLGPSLQPIPERLLVRSLDPRTQVRVMDSGIRILNDHFLRAIKVRSPCTNKESPWPQVTKFDSEASARRKPAVCSPTFRI